MMQILRITSHKKRFLPLLLLGDEQESMIDRYLDRGDLFVMYGEAEPSEPLAVAVVTQEDDGGCELKNLAVAPTCQRQGYGRQLVEYLGRYYQDVCHTLWVGTGDSRQTVSFYRSCGFVYSHTVPDFFTRHYDHPIVEEGRVLTDMIYFRKPLDRLCSVSAAERTEEKIGAWVLLWEESVRATHHFLNEENIETLRPLVADALREIETLLIVCRDEETLAFMGIEQRKIEMLFVRPTCFGEGQGSRLVRTALEQYRVEYVDVNEQNPRAEGFYRHLGFRTVGRTETDAQGNPFPILHMAFPESEIRAREGLRKK